MRCTAAVSVLMVVGIIGYVAHRWHELSQYPEAFRTVALGDTADDVLRKMGPPDVVRSPPDPLWCRPYECTRELMYGQSVPPVWWVIGLDRQGKVVWTAKLDSP